MLKRSKSESSIDTSFSTASNIESELRSVLSEETLDAAATPVFRNRISTYTRVREFPVATSLLKSELLLYPSSGALKRGEPPIFSTQRNKLHFIKKNTPFLTIFTHQNDTKSVYCKIYFKILHNNLTCYVIMFSTGQNLILFNNALKPHSDTIYKGSKLRIFGASGASSTFGNGAVKMFLLDDSSSSLVDGLDYDRLSAMHSIKHLRISKAHESKPLYKAIVNQKRSEVSTILSSANLVASVPFATFFDHGGEKIDGYKLQGYIRLFESTSEPDSPISEDSLVLSTIMLTLIEQEISKMRGNNKPSFVSSANEML